MDGTDRLLSTVRSKGVKRVAHREDLFEVPRGIVIQTNRKGQ